MEPFPGNPGFYEPGEWGQSNTGRFAPGHGWRMTARPRGIGEASNWKEGAVNQDLPDGAELTVDVDGTTMTSEITFVRGFPEITAMDVAVADAVNERLNRQVTYRETSFASIDFGHHRRGHERTFTRSQDDVTETVRRFYAVTGGVGLVIEPTSASDPRAAAAKDLWAQAALRVLEAQGGSDVTDSGDQPRSRALVNDLLDDAEGAAGVLWLFDEHIVALALVLASWGRGQRENLAGVGRKVQHFRAGLAGQTIESHRRIVEEALVQCAEVPDEVRQHLIAGILMEHRAAAPSGRTGAEALSRVSRYSSGEAFLLMRFASTMRSVMHAGYDLEDGEAFRFGIVVPSDQLEQALVRAGITETVGSLIDSLAYKDAISVAEWDERRYGVTLNDCNSQWGITVSAEALELLQSGLGTFSPDPVPAFDAWAEAYSRGSFRMGANRLHFPTPRAPEILLETVTGAVFVDLFNDPGGRDWLAEEVDLAGMRAVVPPVRLSAPRDWAARGSCTIDDPSGEANVHVRYGRIDRTLTSEQYAAEQAALLEDDLPEYELLGAGTLTVGLNRRVCAYLRFAWTTPHEATTEQIQVFFAEAGFGFVATATSHRMLFRRFEHEFDLIFRAIEVHAGSRR